MNSTELNYLGTTFSLFGNFLSALAASEDPCSPDAIGNWLTVLGVSIILKSITTNDPELERQGSLTAALGYLISAAES